MATVGIVGARGYTGKELVELVGRNDKLEVGLAMSARDGMTPEQVADTKLDSYVLLLPNGAAKPYVEAISKAAPNAVIVDISGDHRFDPSWVYGQPERLREKVRGAKRISNPGCYATAMQLSIAPLLTLLEGPVSVFGVSGYSGAGTTPSPKNDPENLRDNLLPYSLTGHLHEREVAHQLGIRLFFAPHVAPFFRGITVTVSVAFAAKQAKDEVWARYVSAYEKEKLVLLSDAPPVVRDIMNKHEVAIGGLTLSEDGKHAVVVATIDNLLGGAATQALRNLNLALGIDELAGIANHAEAS